MGAAHNPLTLRLNNVYKGRNLGCMYHHRFIKVHLAVTSMTYVCAGKFCAERVNREFCKHIILMRTCTRFHKHLGWTMSRLYMLFTNVPIDVFFQSAIFSTHSVDAAHTTTDAGIM